jgi:hypothetical protein
MVIPQVTGAAADRIADAVRDIRSPGATSAHVSVTASVPSPAGADELLAYFIAKAAGGDPQVCTYAWAFRALLNAGYSKFSQAYARKVLDLACRTRPCELAGLGLEVDLAQDPLVAVAGGEALPGSFDGEAHDRSSVGISIRPSDLSARSRTTPTAPMMRTAEMT